MRDLPRRLALTVAWLLAAGLIAFGCAGVVAGIDHPGGPARPELTWAGDQAIAPVLAKATADLSAVSDDVDELGTQGRGALAALIARDTTLVDQALDNGDAILTRIRTSAATVRAALGEQPMVGSGVELRFGATQRADYQALLDAVAATDDLPVAWIALQAAGATGGQLTSLLEGHDTATFDATAAARRRDYAGALRDLDDAGAKLEAAKQLRTRLQNSIDVSTLNEWLSRNETYDAALRRLYQALVTSKGKATRDVIDAIKAEGEARKQLPPDTRGLVLIMAELARGGANQAVIAIEEARGRIDEALGELSTAPTASDEPAPSPSSTGTP